MSWPGETSTLLLDHLIRQLQECRGKRDAKGLGRLEIQEEFELVGEFDGQVCRFGTFEDLVHKDGGTPKHRHKARAIGAEAPRFHVLPPGTRRRQLVHTRKVHDVLAVRVKPGATLNQECLSSTRSEGRQDRVQRLRRGINTMQADPERLGFCREGTGIA